VDSSDEEEAAFLDSLATDFFLEAQGETNFLAFLSFRAEARSFFS
jgi:hypothetical protein